jgi:ABC-type cobalamin/Fe3+-siderophores transport system ATPase subunit
MQTIYFSERRRVDSTWQTKDILSSDMIEKVFNIKTTVIENPVTGKPLIIYN